MRVLRVIGGVDPVFGGPSASSVASCIAAQRAGISTVAVFPGTHDAPAAERLRRERVEVRTFPLDRRFPRGSQRFGVSPALARWLLREAGDFDVIHAHGAWTFTTVAGLLTGGTLGLATVLTPHETLTNFDVEKSTLAKRVTKRLLRSAYLRGFDLVVFSSELEQTDTCGGRRGWRSVVIRHPVEYVSACEERPRDGAELRLGFLGRFDPKKNLDLLVRAVAVLPEGVIVRVAGDGVPEVARAVRRLALELGVEGRIEWLGFIAEEDKPALFRSIDLLVMPSAYECFGVAAAEALAAGVPVLVSPRTGIAEVVAAYGCGYVVEPEVSALARGLAAAVADVPALRARARRARAAAERELSLEAHGERLRREYEALLARRAAAAPSSHRRAREAIG